jgi:hypothetical protein
MEIEGQASEVVTLTLGENEIIQWNNALNEVCHGFVVENFQAAIGIPREAASHLLDRLHEVIPGVGQDFSLDELLALRNSLTAVLAELHPHEFHARMGVSVEESQQMRNTLDELTRQMRFVKTA